MRIQCPACLGEQWRRAGIVCGSRADAEALARLLPSTFAAFEVECHECGLCFNAALDRRNEERWRKFYEQEGGTWPMRYPWPERATPRGGLTVGADVTHPAPGSVQDLDSSPESGRPTSASE